MDYGMIGKIKKAEQYATEERDRIQVNTLSVTFDGKNNPHEIEFTDGAWKCDCDFFQSRGRCSHTITLEKILSGVSWGE